MKQTIQELQIKLTNKQEEFLQSSKALEEVRQDIEKLKAKFESVETLRKQHILFMALESLLHFDGNRPSHINAY